MNQARLLRSALALSLATLLWAPMAFGEDAPLFCALNQALECGPETGCVPRTVENVNLPDFVLIDLENKKIDAFGNPESSRSTTIKNMERLDGKVILQGAEKGRGWTIDMDEETGKFTATVAEDRVGFVIFGTCIER